jgi:hypothetical protein
VSAVGPLGDPGRYVASLDIGGVSDFVRGVQDSRAEQNRRALKSTEHALMAGAAWWTYQRLRKGK